jgi:hypothetical protein
MVSSSPADDVARGATRFEMTDDALLRLMLQMQGDFVRELTLFEVARDGLKVAQRRSKKIRRSRRAELRKMGLTLTPVPNR